ncbi:hypothetical protein F3Y22_tig00116989pilonHSYRG00228 [Hibiscus syriacus]|uniref:RNase H type-1 domain-containing protein n=1 Tax=Hibiscus syriacus TaxID=106335 RepID=A0A6A2WFV0_HIBSY|nr:hypothetical protein F3Y22_tig00116989pilonHSYRG00228 [Hibiscus syriacus]
MEQVKDPQANPARRFQSCMKTMVYLNVVHGFWLVGVQYILAGKSAGWKAFSTNYNIVEGDVLLFHLVSSSKFKAKLIHSSFTKNIGTTSALHAELWSIYEGLLIARSLGVLRLLIQSDCNREVKLVEDNAAIDSHIPLVCAILKQRRSGCWITKVQWISRNENKIADKMAKLASWNHFSLIRFDSPPDELVDLLRLEAVDAQQNDATRHA